MSDEQEEKESKINCVESHITPPEEKAVIKVISFSFFCYIQKT
jgi:hypothetical protein